MASRRISLFKLQGGLQDLQGFCLPCPNSTNVSRSSFDCLLGRGHPRKERAKHHPRQLLQFQLVKGTIEDPFWEGPVVIRSAGEGHSLLRRGARARQGHTFHICSKSTPTRFCILCTQEHWRRTREALYLLYLQVCEQSLGEISRLLRAGSRSTHPASGSHRKLLPLKGLHHHSYERLLFATSNCDLLQNCFLCPLPNWRVLPSQTWQIEKKQKLTLERYFWLLGEHPSN